MHATKTRPWSFKQGLAAGCALLAVSIVLQLSVGQINWALTAWAVNIILLVVLIGMITAMHLLRKKVYLFAWLSSYASCLCAMAFAILATIALGLIAQAPSYSTHASWLNRLLSSWPFVVMYVWLTVSLGLTILRVGMQHWTWRTVAFMLNHVGLFIVLVAATLGNADMQRLTMMVGKESMGYDPQSVAFNDDSPTNTVVELDFALVLKDFQIEYYAPDSLQTYNIMPMPKSYKSHVEAYDKDADKGKLLSDAIVQVNKPLSVNGWNIYQYGYDNSIGEQPRYSTFLLVRDPWMPWVFIGIYMMLAGALALIIQAAILYGMRGRGSRWTIATLLLCIMITAYVFIPIISNKQLMPALQSPWFAPHVLVYMIAYALMGTAALLAIIGLLRGRSVVALSVFDNIVYVGLAFLTFGMLFGALWAKEAWGHYWSWDPKETWAAITWLAYLVYLHFRLARPSHTRTALWMLIISFALLQMCWWGINYLPSAMSTSMHTYN